MTVSAQNSYISYTGNGSTTAYSWPYKLFTATDLKVYTVVIATGVETLQTSGGGGTYDYTIAYDSVSEAWTVTLNNNLPATHKLFLTRVMDLAQTVDYIDGDAFPASAHEDALDKIMLKLQQHEEQLKRSLKFKQSTATRSEPDIPELTANTLIKVNSAGNGFETQSTTNVATVAGIASDITAVSAIASDVTAVAADATDIGAVAGKATEIGLLGTADVVADLAILGTTDVVADLNTLGTAAIVTDMDLLATSANVTAMGHLGTSANVTAMGHLGTSANVTAMGHLGTSANVTAMGHLGTSANVTAMGLLGTSDVVTDMGLLATADVIADMALLANADVIADMNTLATADIVSDLNTLATSDIVADINLLATSDIVSDLNTLATSDIVSDLNTLATSDIVSDINTLATSDIVSDLNQLATSDFVSDLNLMATSTNISNLDTVANNITGINSFADRYRVASSDPSSSLDAADLAFNTTANALKYYDGSSWNSVAAQDTQVKISGNDTSADVLINKLTAGNLITLTETNDGSNETITVASTGASTGKAIAMAIVFGG